MHDFDQRQYTLMLKSLEDFLAGRMLLDTLINNLEGLLNMLSSDDKKYGRTRFYRCGAGLRMLALSRYFGTLALWTREHLSASLQQPTS